MKITVKIRVFFENETKFCNFKIFFIREKKDLEIQFIIKVHVLNYEKYICIFFIFIFI
jgi:hypothetical protein